MSEEEKDVLLRREDRAALCELEDKEVSPAVLQHAANPRNWGWMVNPDGQASAAGICADTVSICLQVEGPKITSARFRADGCGFTIACGSVATELAQGMSLKHALRFKGEQIIKYLGGLPKEQAHCADLAANALRAAAEDALAHLREPWKGAYRTFKPLGR